MFQIAHIIYTFNNKKSIKKGALIHSAPILRKDRDINFGFRSPLLTNNLHRIHESTRICRYSWLIAAYHAIHSYSRSLCNLRIHKCCLQTEESKSDLYIIFYMKISTYDLIFFHFVIKKYASNSCWTENFFSFLTMLISFVTNYPFDSTCYYHMSTMSNRTWCHSHIKSRSF